METNCGTSTAPEGAHSLRLPQACRLKRRSEIARVYAEGVRARGRLLLVVAAPGGLPEMPRLALSVGRKFSKSAVLRNRVRRLMREAFRHERSQLPPLDMIFIPVGRGLPYTLAALRDELMTIAPKLERKLSR